VAGYFSDSSALVKRYVTEAGTPWVRGLTHRNSGHPIFISRITAVEVTAAVVRRRRGGTLTSAQASSIRSRFREHLAGRYTILELTPGVLTDAMQQANTHELRAYDAVQLAVAIELNRLNQGGIVFVSADQALNDAASAEGMAVENPNLRP
jgi:predicted nucleic acid-binding protein